MYLATATAYNRANRYISRKNVLKTLHINLSLSEPNLPGELLGDKADVKHVSSPKPLQVFSAWILINY
jgi:hypothetical protein